jgi:hypothetical protein
MNRKGYKTIPYLILALLLVSSVLSAADFTGDWVVVEVVENDEFPWHKEIKYPASFSLNLDGTVLVGFYKDQFDFECEFKLAQLINDSEELLLAVCGTTKHSSSWAPIHKVKMIDGKLHGVVVTSDKKFEWIAEKAGD